MPNSIAYARTAGNYRSSSREKDTRPRLWAAGLAFGMWDSLPPPASKRLTQYMELLVAQILKAKGHTAFIPKRNGLAAHAAGYATVASHFGIVVTSLAVTQKDLGTGPLWVWKVTEEESSTLWSFGPDTDPGEDFAQLVLLVAGIVAQQRELDGKMREGTVLIDLVLVEHFASLLSQKTGRPAGELRQEAMLSATSILKANHEAYDALRRRLLVEESIPPAMLAELLATVRDPEAAGERGSASAH